MSEKSGTSPVVFVVDDDASVRESLKELLESVGLRVEAFESADVFLANRQPDAASCLVLDVRLPGLSGLQFQTELTKAGISLPIIFITGHGDIPMSVRAMKSGAVEFLTKPFRDQDLLEAVRAAIERDRGRRERENSLAGLKTRFASLTAREKEVFAYLSAGFVNKRIAAQMGISEVTVKVHRRNIMQKMSARSLAELVRMADLLGVGQAVSTAD
jgi:FixJ family two-component response regulator